MKQSNADKHVVIGGWVVAWDDPDAKPLMSRRERPGGNTARGASIDASSTGRASRAARVIGKTATVAPGLRTPSYFHG